MRAPRTHFICPSCFRRYEKDGVMQMMTSGIRVIGDGLRWSGDLETDLPAVKRVVYCKDCSGPIDMHALLRGHLDDRESAILLSVAFGAAGVGFYLADFSLWASQP